MAVDLFQQIDTTKVEKLPFIKGALYLGYAIKDEYRIGKAYEISSEDRKKLVKLLHGKDKKTIGAKDRVFVLSGCKIPQFKIKEFLRQNGAVFTGNIEDATVFVGNGNIYRELRPHDLDLLDSTSMVIHGLLYPGTVPLKDGNVYCNIDACVPNTVDLKTVRIEFTKAAACSAANNLISKGVHEADIMTPYAAKLAYEILSRRIPTITEDALLLQMKAQVKLDKHMCEQLMKMLESPDEADRKTAHEIMANCDHTDADLYLYKIARKHHYELGHSRFKNVKLFYKEANIGGLSSRSEETFLENLRKQGKMDKEALDELLPLVYAELQRNLQIRTSKVFKINIELRKEFEEVLGPHEYNKEIRSRSTREEEESED